MTLRDLEVLVLDAQATGASPAHGHLLELGWAWTTASRESLRVQAHLLALPDEATLPRIITRVTGIEQADLDDAADVDAIWDGFVDECSARAPARAVIHCARFEHSFLQPRIAPEQTLPFASVCTLELARRLLPDLPRRGLRALAGYFGYGVDQLRRCEDHVHATAFVWRHLVDMLAEQGVETWEEAAAFAGTAAPKRSKKRVFPIPKETRLAVPDRPGVYRMLRTNGDVLYVGKATSLKRRVNSYFQKQSGRNERMLELLSQVRDLDVTPTATPLEAALLETDTIKMLQPPYNMALLETSREPCFVTRDLLDAAPEASEAYPVGPLPSSWRQQRYVGLHGLLAGDRTTDTITRAFGWEPEALPESVLDEGLALFEARNPGATRSRAAFAAAGTRRWNTQARKDEDFQGEDGEEHWDPDRVLRRLEDTLVFFSLELRRAAWLRRLANAAVTYDDGVVRTLLLRGGRVSRRADGDVRPAVRPEPVEFDIATYDRLRVLTTELRRVAGKGGAVTMLLASGAELGPDALARILPWV